MVTDCLYLHRCARHLAFYAVSCSITVYLFTAKPHQGNCGRPFVKRFALCYRTVVCLSVYLVTLVHCGQTVGWMEMPLGMEVGLGPGDIVLDGDPAPPTERGTAAPPHFSIHFALAWSPISATAELLLIHCVACISVCSFSLVLCPILCCLN